MIGGESGAGILDGDEDEFDLVTEKGLRDCIGDGDAQRETRIRKAHARHLQHNMFL